jgi:hypothetical protein
MRALARRVDDEILHRPAIQGGVFVDPPIVIR